MTKEGIKKTGFSKWGKVVRRNPILNSGSRQMLLFLVGWWCTKAHAYTPETICEIRKKKGKGLLLLLLKVVVDVVERVCRRKGRVGGKKSDYCLLTTRRGLGYFCLCVCEREKGVEKLGRI